MSKFALILGVLLLIAGGLVASGMFSYQDKEEVLRVGDASLSVTKDKKPDRNLGYGLLVLGAVLTVVGLVVKKR